MVRGIGLWRVIGPACCLYVWLSAFPAGLRAGQDILVLILILALVAGAIADEKRSKTLHYLLASPLTGPEIVLGKLLVRMLYVGVLLGVSFPVMSLLVLMGGVDPLDAGPGVLRCAAEYRVVPGHAVDLGLRRSPAGLAKRCSSRLGWSLLWLIVPPVLKNGRSPAGLPADDALWWLADWLGASSPVDAFTEILRSVFSGSVTTFQEERSCG